VGTPSDRPQIVLGVKLAEVRRDLLTQAGVSGIYRGPNARVGSDAFRTDQPFTTGGTTGGATGGTNNGTITLPAEARFLTVLSDFGMRDFLALIQAEAQRGRARLLAEPNLMAANNEQASFLAGGEIPIPIAQPGQGGQTFVTIQYREFGVRLTFTPEILGDSLVKLKVRPEVSSLDYGNAVLLSGFRIPALRTRRIESTVDVRRSQSLVISGLFNEERQRTRIGIPILMDIPILGNLFSSTQWQRSETELVAIVTPVVINPRRPRAQDLPPIQPDTSLPARDALEKRLPPSQTPRSQTP
jgi:pilus assembly protein CpaC